MQQAHALSNTRKAHIPDPQLRHSQSEFFVSAFAE